MKKSFWIVFIISISAFGCGNSTSSDDNSINTLIGEWKAIDCFPESCTPEDKRISFLTNGTLLMSGMDPKMSTSYKIIDDSVIECEVTKNVFCEKVFPDDWCSMTLYLRYHFDGKHLKLRTADSLKGLIYTRFNF